MNTKDKKGISLIVLVITILVMIILAGVVIVSLQNDNPINKAKFAKNMDSIQNIRSAITQYAVTAQATESDSETFGDKMNKILKDADSTYQKIGEYTKILIIDENVKKLLGVDPSQFIGEDIGYFLVNPKTGASLYQFNTDAFDEQIKTSKTEGILKNNLINEIMGDQENFKSWKIDKNIKNKMYFQFKSDKTLDGLVIYIQDVKNYQLEKAVRLNEQPIKVNANEIFKMETNISSEKLDSLKDSKELRFQIYKEGGTINTVNFTDVVLTNTNII